MEVKELLIRLVQVRDPKTNREKFYQRGLQVQRQINYLSPQGKKNCTDTQCSESNILGLWMEDFFPWQPYVQILQTFRNHQDRPWSHHYKNNHYRATSGRGKPICEEEILLRSLKDEQKAMWFRGGNMWKRGWCGNRCRKGRRAIRAKHRVWRHQLRHKIERERGW